MKAVSHSLLVLLCLAGSILIPFKGVLGHGRAATTEYTLTPTFLFPSNGKLFPYGGSYLFQVRPVPGAVGYLWSFVQNSAIVYQNLAWSGHLSSATYTLTPESNDYQQIHPGVLQVWARALLHSGQWSGNGSVQLKIVGQSTAISRPTPYPSPTGKPHELALIAATASSVFPAQDANGYGPENAIDGNVNTLWISADGNPVGQWLNVMLQGNHTVTGISIYSLGAGDNGGRVRRATFSFSSGGSQALLPSEQFTDTRGWQFRALKTTKTNSIRITVNSVYAGSSFNDIIIAEIKIYGY